MTNFIVTVPGTFTRMPDTAEKSRLLTALQGADPDEVGDVPPDLDVLSTDATASTFTMRLEVEADDSRAAQEQALGIARDALAQAGFDEATAPMGPPAMTAIDTDQAGS